jgi:hypothetical protein
MARQILPISLMLFTMIPQECSHLLITSRKKRQTKVGLSGNSFTDTQICCRHFVSFWIEHSNGVKYPLNSAQQWRKISTEKSLSLALSLFLAGLTDLMVKKNV